MHGECLGEKKEEADESIDPGYQNHLCIQLSPTL